jgi:serine protease
MQQLVIRALIILIGVLVFPTLPSAARPQPMPQLSTHADDYQAHHVLIQLAPGHAPTELGRTLTPLFADWYQVPVQAPETADQLVQQLAQHPAVQHAERDVLLHTFQSPPLPNATPNDPFYPFQWNLFAIGAPEVWTRSIGQGVIVAVLDTGISLGPDLACHTLVAPFDATTNTPGLTFSEDKNGHGTHVSGTVAQCTDNARSVAGVAFGTQLMPVKVCADNGSCPLAAIASGIIWATDNGARVINMSLGASCVGVGTGIWPNCSSAIVNDAINHAVAADVVLVAASGNGNGITGDPLVGFPANHPEVLGVGATDRFNMRAGYSNFGEALQIVAPGGDTSSNISNDEFGDGIVQETLSRACGFALDEAAYRLCAFQGTSMASPHVAGAVALLRAAYPEASRTQIHTALLRTAQDLGEPGLDPLYGYGLLQIPAALSYLDQQQFIYLPLLGS